LYEVPDTVKMPDAAYRFDPASNNKVIIILGNDKLFLCDKH